MNRLVFVFYSLTLALSIIPGGLAGPACAHKNRGSPDCVQKCKSKWGWSGSMMGTDRWGSVISKVESSPDAWETTIAKACGSSVASVPAAATPSVVAPTVPVIGAGNDPVESARPLPLSSSVLSSSSVAVASSAISSSSAPRPTTTPAVTKNPQIIVSTSTRFATSIRPTPVPTPTQKTTTTQAPPPPSPPPPPAPPAPPANSGSGSTSSSDIQAYLSAHNSVRANHGAAALSWSDELASKAQQWANGCKFQHSGGTLGAFGENLAAGTGSAYGIPQAIKSWTDEVSQYDPNNPQPSHFTQVVWKGSKQVGCAVQECDGIFSSQFGKAKYYVCEYSPAGNVIGQFPQNVQA